MLTTGSWDALFPVSPVKLSVSARISSMTHQHRQNKHGHFGRSVPRTECEYSLVGHFIPDVARFFDSNLIALVPVVLLTPLPILGQLVGQIDLEQRSEGLRVDWRWRTFIGWDGQLKVCEQ